MQCLANAVRGVAVSLAMFGGLVGCGTTVDGTQTLDASPADPASECLGAHQLVTRFDPLALYKSAARCVAQGRLDDAVFLYGIAGSEGRFDTMRVVDTTAHQVTYFMSVMFTKGAGEEAASRFSDHMRAQLSSDETRKASCRRLEMQPPPSYHPGYMIGHGMGAFVQRGANDGLEPLADPRVSWKTAIHKYMDCGL